MGRYIGKRVWQLLPILLGISFITFLLLYLSPGDPAQKKLGAQGIAVSQEVLERTREEMGLHRPFLVQYADWLLGVLRGDWGLAYQDGMPVLPKLLKGLANTGILSAASLLLSLGISIPLGILSAVKKDHLIDMVIRSVSFVGNSLPNFLISVLLMYALCIRVKLLPVIANHSVKGLILPCLALALPMIGRFIQQVRAEVLEQLHRPYVLGARARGVQETRVLFGDVLHNSMISILTIIGLAIGSLMAGSVVIETIFGWPGIGKLVMDAISDRDYPIIQGFVLVMSLIYVLINLLTDISYHYFDPRVRGE